MNLKFGLVNYCFSSFGNLKNIAYLIQFNTPVPSDILLFCGQLITIYLRWWTDKIIHIKSTEHVPFQWFMQQMDACLWKSVVH